MTQIGRVLSHAGEDCRRWCSWAMRWKTCRPLRRRAWLAGISVSGRGRPRGDPNVSRDRVADWGAHCRFDPGSARQLASSCARVAGYGLAGAGAFSEWQRRCPEVAVSRLCGRVIPDAQSPVERAHDRRISITARSRRRALLNSTAGTKTR